MQEISTADQHEQADQSILDEVEEKHSTNQSTWSTQWKIITHTLQFAGLLFPNLLKVTSYNLSYKIIILCKILLRIL